MPCPDVVFITAEPGSPGPAMVIGGLTVLERRLREAERRGVRRAIVACAGPLPLRPLALEVERAAPDATPPPDAEVVRADEVAGVRLDSPRARRRAEWAQLQSLPKSYQGLTDALVNRHVSLRITRMLARTPLTPNMVTFAALASGLAAAALLAWGAGPAAWIAAGALIQLHSILDSCDGELARLRFQFSRFGQWLDNVADDITDAALILALGVAAGGPGWLAVGVAGAAGRVVTQLALYWQVRRAGGDFLRFRWWFETDAATIDEVYDPTSPLTWVRALGRRDTYLFIWAVLCAVGVPWAAAAHGAALSAVYVVMTFIHLAKCRSFTTSAA
jgi:phosphatidylglycerophosphate synthase